MSLSKDAATLKIKTAVVKRTMKDFDSYREELKENERMLEKVRASDDHSKLKQWESVCAETRAMIPDTRARLATAVNDLATYMTALPETVVGAEVMQGARDMLDSAKEVLE